MSREMTRACRDVVDADDVGVLSAPKDLHIQTLNNHAVILWTPVFHCNCPFLFRLMGICRL